MSVLIVVGVVLGVWRYLGDGKAITDPAWYSHASDHLWEFGRWASGAVDRLVNRGLK